MKSRSFSICLVLLLALFACDSDQDDPYGDYDGPDIQWPSLDPNRYHWDGLQDPYYEGWFFRVTLPEQERSFGFLYIVHNPASVEPGRGSAILMVANSDGEVIRRDYPLDQFKASIQKLDVRIGQDNIATTTKIAGSLHDEQHTAAWNINIDVQERWESTMGTLNNIPYLPINWYVGALRATANGTIQWDGNTYHLQDAQLFQDKNWGDYFPEAYVWLQGMNFADGDDSAIFAGGLVNGLDAGMFAWRSGDQFYETRSQDLNCLTDIDTDIDQGEVQVTIICGDNGYLLEGFFADCPPATLPAPQESGFEPYSQMALNGRLRLTRYSLADGQWRVQETATSNVAGIEIAGNYNNHIQP